VGQEVARVQAPTALIEASLTGEAQVKAHTRHNDYIRRTPKKGETP
jgi:hypothetical protein